METISAIKMIAYLEQHTELLSNWHLKFISDIKTRISNEQKVSVKQKNVLFEEVRRIFFLQQIHLFED